MKIGQPADISLPSAAQLPPASAKSNSTSSAAPAALPGVAVTVSTLARTLDQITKSDPSDIDANKVTAIRLAIQNGTYKVNPEAIADKLLANAQEMLDHTRPS
ncbi:MAG: hypothetical protein RIS34_481 [Pseudomonadota bacterium]|jgi:negative regulator of flagellin synthesis FlgM